jgi:4-hydroxyphenylpyruvate dioxygenase
MTIEFSPLINNNNNNNNFENIICYDFDHVVFYVSSPKLVAQYMIKTFGFHLYAYKGLETGSRDISSTVIKNGNVIFVFLGAIRPLNKNSNNNNNNNNNLVDNIHNHISIHGDSVKDVAFKSKNLELLINNLKLKNSLNLLNSIEPIIINDEFGTIKFLTINTNNDLIHTIIDRSNYKGFLPGYKLINNNNNNNNNNNSLFPFPSFSTNTTTTTSSSSIKFNSIDHCVQNSNWNEMLNNCNFYKDYLNFHVFWSVDENQIHTKYSALKSTVMTSENEIIKLPINEPAIGLKKSQIEEFIEFNNGSGIQHIAIKVDNIIDTIKKLKNSGAEFIRIPDEYYKNLEKKIKFNKHPKIKENLKIIKKLGILIDFDENGYLLQLFTKPIFERPTFFLEIIQRNNHNGFGAGNFKGLFEALEKDQELRGNLVEQNI